MTIQNKSNSYFEELTKEEKRQYNGGEPGDAAYAVGVASAAATLVVAAPFVSNYLLAKSILS